MAAPDGKQSKLKVLADRVGNFLSAHHISVAFVLYFLSCAWVLGFPAVNISSGELKPRGIFVDENAILVNSALPGDFYVKRDCAVLAPTYVTARGVQVVSVDSPYYSKSKESTVLLFQHQSYNAEVVDSIVANLALQLKSVQWLAKKVIIVKVVQSANATNNSFSDELEELLTSYTTYSPDTPANFPKLGLIRDAYVVDFTQLSSGRRLQFSSVQMRLSGINGQLPNMDMVSTPLTMDRLRARSVPIHTESDVLLLSGLYGALQLVTQDTAAGALWRTSASALVSAADAASAVLPSGYVLRLSGLLSSLLSLSSGPSGLHAHFVARNIDAVTLRLMPAEGAAAPSLGEDALLTSLMRLVYLSSNLHEELHHSLHQYLLMGSGHFVGLPEYGLVAGLMLLSLLALMLSHSHQVRIARLPAAVLSCVVDVLPTLALLALSSSLAPLTVARLFAAVLVGGLTLRVAATQPGSDSIQTERSAVIFTALLLAFAWLAAQHFSLALILYVPVFPAAALTSRYLSSSAGGDLTLLVAGLLVSPSGVLMLLGDEWHRKLLADWLQFGSFALPSALLVTSATSCLVLSALAIRWVTEMQHVTNSYKTNVISDS